MASKINRLENSALLRSIGQILFYYNVEKQSQNLISRRTGRQGHIRTVNTFRGDVTAAVRATTENNIENSTLNWRNKNAGILNVQYIENQNPCPTLVHSEDCITINIIYSILYGGVRYLLSGSY